MYSFGFCIHLKKFKQMFRIKFWVKYNWNFGGFLKVHITFYKHISNVSYLSDAQNNYLSIELLHNLLATFFVEKPRFFQFFQIQNLEWGYTGEKLKLETTIFHGKHFWRYLQEKPIFWKKLNWIRESSTRLMTWVKKNCCSI